MVVHGLLSPQWFVRLLARRLRARGFDVHLVDLATLCVQDVRFLAVQLGASIEQTLSRTGAPRCRIVALSQGAVLAAYYVRLLGGAARVERLVALGAPFRGTWAAVPGLAVLGGWSRGIWQLLPGSALVRELEAAADPGVPVISLALAGDLVVPPSRTTLPGARSVVLQPRRRGPLVHQTLGLDGELVDEIARWLTADV